MGRNPLRLIYTMNNITQIHSVIKKNPNKKRDLRKNVYDLIITCEQESFTFFV